MRRGVAEEAYFSDNRHVHHGLREWMYFVG